MSKRLLIIGPAWVGDMVMAQSLFKFLHQLHANLTLDVLAPAWTLPLLKRMPEVSHGIALPFNHGEFKGWQRYQFATALRQSSYDQAIVLPHSFKAALIPWFARIPKRTGYLGECRHIVLNDIRRLNKKNPGLMVNRFLSLGLPKGEILPTEIPYPQLQISSAELITSLANHRLMLSDHPILVLAPGAEYGESKRWPVEYFAEVANQQLALGWKIWLLGSAKDKPLTDQIMVLTQKRCENLAGQINLTEAIDLLSLVKGVVTNDSGLMHIAAALQKPIVALYGSTSPEMTPPLTTKATILQQHLTCQPCFERSCPLKHQRCMRELTPDRVLSIITKWE